VTTAEVTDCAGALAMFGRHQDGLFNMVNVLASAFKNLN